MGHVLLNFAIEVEGKFFVEFAFDFVVLEEHAGAVSQIIEQRSRSFENLLDSGGELAPGFGLGFQLLMTSARELVVLGATIIVGGAPSCLDPAAALEAMQRGIEGALLDAQDFTRDLLNAL